MSIVSERDVVLILVPKEIKHKHPSLAVMKFITLIKRRGCVFEIHKEKRAATVVPTLIFLSTIFTYDSRTYGSWMSYYKKLYPDVRFVVGGIFASIMPEWFLQYGVETVRGLVEELDAEFPDLLELEKFGFSVSSLILYASRGCPNRCEFCCVPSVEGAFRAKESIAKEIEDGMRQKTLRSVVLFDNNFTVHPGFFNIVDELRHFGLPVDFSQGMDCMKMTEGMMKALSMLRFASQSEKGTTYIRFAFDRWSQREGLERTLEWCKRFGIKAGYFAYFLYNHRDSPADFYHKLVCVHEIVQKVGRTVFLFPQEYAPLDSLERHVYVDKGWTRKQLCGLRRMYTHVHGFMSITPSGNHFNWFGRNEQEFLHLLNEYGEGKKVEKYE